MRHPQHLVSGTTSGVTLPRWRRLTRLPPRFRPVAFSIPLGLIDGRPLRPFSRAISSRCAITICFSSDTSPSSSTNRASSSAREVRQIGGRRHATTESYSPASGQAGKSRLPRGCAPIARRSRSGAQIQPDELVASQRSQAETARDPGRRQYRHHKPDSTADLRRRQRDGSSRRTAVVATDAAEISRIAGCLASNGWPAAA